MKDPKKPETARKLCYSIDLIVDPTANVGTMLDTLRADYPDSAITVKNVAVKRVPVP